MMESMAFDIVERIKSKLDPKFGKVDAGTPLGDLIQYICEELALAHSAVDHPNDEFVVKIDHRFCNLENRVLELEKKLTQLSEKHDTHSHKSLQEHPFNRPEIDYSKTQFIDELKST